MYRRRRPFTHAVPSKSLFSSQPNNLLKRVSSLSDTDPDDFTFSCYKFSAADPQAAPGFSGASTTRKPNSFLALREAAQSSQGHWASILQLKNSAFLLRPTFASSPEGEHDTLLDFSHIAYLTIRRHASSSLSD
jgi:hypothetical protein